MEDTCKQARARTPCRAPVSPAPLMQSFTRFCCCCYSKGTKRFSKTRGASKLPLTWRSHTLACSQPSRQHPRTPPARNSAFAPTPEAALILRGSVRSWARPSPRTTRISMVEQTSARKMVTYDRSRPTHGMPTGSSPQWPPLLFARLVSGSGLETQR